MLVDKYLDRADELDVDALCDKDGNVVICGIMQHIEQAGVHSGAAPALLPCSSFGSQAFLACSMRPIICSLPATFSGLEEPLRYQHTACMASRGLSSGAGWVSYGG